MSRAIVSFIIFVLFCSGVMSQNIYQLPNPGFEQWDGGIESEPTHWNTFSTSDGSYSSLASTNHHYRRSGHRPGGSGSYYLTLYTKSIMGVKANGNMTTGRVHAGSMSASSSDNYNYTQRSNSNHCQPFTATPDSLYVWVSFYADDASSEAQINAIVHGDNDFRSANDEGTPSLYKAKAVARTSRTTSSATQMQWKQLRVPFIYSGSSEPYYILINMTTNYQPGEGHKNDSLSIDDIEFIYSAWLKDIKLRGTTIEGFSKGKLSYQIHDDEVISLTSADVTYTTEADDATVDVEVLQLDCDTMVEINLSVTAEDGTTKKVYSVRVTSGDPASVESLAEKSISVFPNPATDFVTIEAEGEIEIVDMKGRTVIRQVCHGTTMLDISNLSKGIYYIKNHNCKIIKK